MVTLQGGHEYRCPKQVSSRMSAIIIPIIILALLVHNFVPCSQGIGYWPIPRLLHTFLLSLNVSHLFFSLFQKMNSKQTNKPQNYCQLIGNAGEFSFYVSSVFGIIKDVLKESAALTQQSHYWAYTLRKP